SAWSGDMDDLDKFVESTVLRITPDNSAKALTIDLRLADGSSSYTVQVDGVYDLQMDGVRLNNIVDEVVWYPESMSDDEMLLNLQYLMTGDAGPFEVGRFPYVDLKAEELRAGNLRLWEFRAVYGASLIVVAKSLSVRKSA